MINLDDIGSRVLRGYYTQKDVSDLLGEILIVDIPPLQRRFDTGTHAIADVQQLYRLVEDVYRKKYKRPTSTQQVSAQKAQGEADKLVADAARVAQGAAAAVAEQQAQALWQQTAQRASAVQAMNVAVQAAIDKFNASQKAADEVVSKRQARAAEIKTQLNG